MGRDSRRELKARYLVTLQLVRGGSAGSLRRLLHLLDHQYVIYGGAPLDD